MNGTHIPAPTFKNPITVSSMPSKHHIGGGWIRPVTRLAVYLRDGFRCTWCGADLTARRPEHVTLDHVRPRDFFGGNEPGNLVTACKPCNAARGTYGVTTWCRILACRAHGVDPNGSFANVPRPVLLAIHASATAHVARVKAQRARKPNRDLARAIMAGAAIDPRPVVRRRKERRACVHDVNMAGAA